MKTSQALTKLGACAEAIEWSRAFPTQQAAWMACERADWMMWYLNRLVELGIFPRKRLVLLACKLARTVLKYVPDDEHRPRNAIETAEAWAREDKGVSWDGVCVALDAAADAAHTYCPSVAYNASPAAYNAASAAYNASSIASACATPCSHAANVAIAVYNINAKTKAHQKMCEIIRKEVPDITR